MRRLKIAFAMGGGVSLGTFSGAALTETIKQLLVRSAIPNYSEEGKHVHKAYDEIVVDTLSGASAGAMSLAIMLRIMTHYQDKLLMLNELDDYNECADEVMIRDEIIAKLEKDFGKDYHDLSEVKKEQLFTTQVAQEFQRLVWVKKVNILDLINLNGENQNKMLDKGSLLDRSFLEDLSKRIIKPEKRLPGFCTSPLADRVLFACTLTRMSSENMNSAASYETDYFSNSKEQYQKILKLVGKDGVSSKNHKDVRVFDLNFKTPSASNYDENSRWIEAYDGDDAGVESIKEEGIWNQITATTLACGAFPLAFEQVALKRKGNELRGGPDGKKSDEVYSYVDGGTLNNEPIREAFRLSSFIDSMDESEDFDRVVIFIDPFVSHNPESRNKQYYQSYLVSEETGEIQKTPGLAKIISSTGPLLSLLRNQSTISELDKAIVVNKKFAKREKLRRFYSDTVKLGFPKHWSKIKGAQQVEIVKTIDTVVGEIKGSIEDLQERITIPSAFPILQNEIRKMVRNDKNDYFSPDFKTEIAENSEFLSLFSPHGDLASFYESYPKLIQDFIKALYFLMIDVSLDLIGKTTESHLLAIGPLYLDHTGGHEPVPVELKGQPLHGFLGFFYENYRAWDFNIGIKCTQSILCSVNMVDQCDLDYKPDTLVYPREDGEMVKNETLDVLITRLYKQLIKDNFFRMLDAKGKKWSIQNLLSDSALKLIANFSDFEVKKLVNEVTKPKKHSTSYEVWIRLPGDKYNIKKQKKGVQDIRARLIDDTEYMAIQKGFYLMAEVEMIYHHGRWQWDAGNYLNSGSLQLEKDRNWLQGDQDLLLIDLGDPQKVFEQTRDLQYPIIHYDLSGLEEKDVEHNIDVNQDYYNEKRSIIEMITALDDCSALN